MPVLAYLAGVGRFNCVHFQEEASLGADPAHPSPHSHTSITNTAEVGVRPGWFQWARAQLCPSRVETCILLRTYVAGRLY